MKICDTDIEIEYRLSFFLCLWKSYCFFPPKWTKEDPHLHRENDVLSVWLFQRAKRPTEGFDTVCIKVSTNFVVQFDPEAICELAQVVKIWFKSSTAGLQRTHLLGLSRLFGSFLCKTYTVLILSWKIDQINNLLEESY